MNRAASFGRPNQKGSHDDEQALYVSDRNGFIVAGERSRDPHRLCGLGSGGGHFRYDYNIINDSLGTPIGLFDIVFDITLYDESSLNIVTPGPLAGDWSEALLGSAPGQPIMYDALALSLAAEIAVGASQFGFAVEFNWIGGAGGPGAQPFEIYDPNTFALLDTGTTQQVSSGSAPSPGIVPLMATGGLLLWGAAMRRRSRNQSENRASR